MAETDPLKGYGWNPKDAKIKFVGEEKEAWHNDPDIVRTRLNLVSDSAPGSSYFSLQSLPFLCELKPQEEGSDHRVYEMRHNSGFVYNVHVDTDPLDGHNLSLDNDDDVLKFCDGIVYPRVKMLFEARRLPEENWAFQFEDGGLKNLA